MKFTKSMDAAYWKAFDLSKAAHGEHANRARADTADDQSTMTARLQAPGDLLEAYTDEDDQAAFYAGWLDGARGSSTSRRRMEGSSQPH
jgi:hypothetical protein